MILFSYWHSQGLLFHIVTSLWNFTKGLHYIHLYLLPNKSAGIRIILFPTSQFTRILFQSDRHWTFPEFAFQSPFYVSRYPVFNTRRRRQCCHWSQIKLLLPLLDSSAFQKKTSLFYLHIYSITLVFLHFSTGPKIKTKIRIPAINLWEVNILLKTLHQ